MHGLTEVASYATIATFFVLGRVAQEQPDLVRSLAAGGHEIGTHGWDH
ncbi:MAG: polysaccharide deacetylase family protein, partial [Anaerolineae bacterium]|nr:polysaccharide deacetylase family protein [Anaerolineae bacterium]